MHLFLYQASRHQKPPGYYSSRRLSQSTIRCDFDLELLKRGIKGRYEIIGHGIHPFQKAMGELGMIEDFYGHIIEIEDSRNAVWFKLNYDNIGKNVTKYIGGWKDLNPDDLKPAAVEIKQLTTELTNLQHSRQQINNQFYYLNRYVQEDSTHHECMAASIKTGKQFVIDLNHDRVDLEFEIQRVNEQIAAAKNKVLEYLKSHKG